MKKFYLLLCTLLGCLTGTAQGLLPEFSTEEDPMWYYVQFKAGSACLADNGAGQPLVTATKASADAQLWQFIGTQDNMKMKCKTGRYVNYANGRFTASTTGIALKLVASTNSSATDCWEIQRQGSSSSMNQWGGAGAGKQLGEWTAGDTNNPLSFIATSTKLPEFSSESSEKWYFIQFCQGKNTLADKGLGEPARPALTEPSDEQLWKLVGDKDNFQIVNKLGHYIEVSTNGLPAGDFKGGPNPTPLRTSASPYSAGFSLVESTSATHAPAWCIKPNDRAGMFNQWGGGEAGVSIGLWTDKSDNNNALLFIDPDKMQYADFKVSGIAAFTPQNKLSLWYDAPSTVKAVGDKWAQYSLPLGNGQLGCCLLGGVMADEIQFNEKTLWSGRSSDNSANYGDYENFGSLFAEEISGELGMTQATMVKDYVRVLDLTNATGSVAFTNADGSISYNRTYFVSNPAQVIAARYQASQAGKVSLRFTLVSGKPGINATTTYSADGGQFAGKLETISYRAGFKVVNKGGTMTSGEDGITVTGADEVIVYLTGATDFDPYKTTYISNTAALPATIEARLNDAAASTWDELYSAHVADFKSFFDRSNFELAGTTNNQPTDALIDAYKGGTGANARMLEQLYYAYGRYLEICASRGVDLPSNLQGIWNNSSEPAWNADIHANINVQMNYWPAETTNLTEMHMPFLNYIINMAGSAQWKKYAQDAGQSRGWTCYTENNIFGGVGSFMHNYVIANAWYCTHLWQHYRYTLDRDFLKRAFPAMLSASQFWLDRLILASDGTYVCPREYSPEHGPSEDGVAHAQQLVYDLLSNTKAAIDILGDDAEISAADLEKLTTRLAKLDKGLAIETYDGHWAKDNSDEAKTRNGIAPGTQILREWKTSTYKSGADGHRHMSHLMCLYPFNQVTPSSPYFKAAVNSLQLRGDASTGWSMGWKINLWARAQDGDHAHKILTLALAHGGGGGINYNLYDTHPPFQIDGNYGACAGIAEMLMQSHTDTIQVLPALPSVWKEGSVKGLKAVSDFTVDIAWKAGKATRVTVVNNQGQPGVIAYKGIAAAKQYVNGVLRTDAEGAGADVITLPAQKGAVTVFDFDGSYIPTGIAAAATEGISLSANGRTLTLAGNVAQVKVYDLQGRLVKSARGNVLTLGKACGQNVVVEAEAADGSKATFKAVLK